MRRKVGVTLNGFLHAEESGKTAAVFRDGRQGRFIKVELSYEVAGAARCAAKHLRRSDVAGCTAERDAQPRAGMVHARNGRECQAARASL